MVPGELARVTAQPRHAEHPFSAWAGGAPEGEASGGVEWEVELFGFDKAVNWHQVPS